MVRLGALLDKLKVKKPPQFKEEVERRLSSSQLAEVCGLARAGGSAAASARVDVRVWQAWQEETEEQKQVREAEDKAQDVANRLQ